MHVPPLAKIPICPGARAMVLCVPLPDSRFQLGVCSGEGGTYPRVDTSNNCLDFNIT